MLALLVPDITNPHNFGLIRGAEAQARAAGYTLVLGDTQGSAELEADHLDRLGSAVDGFVLASSRLPSRSCSALHGRRPVGAVQPGGRRLPQRGHRLRRRQPADRRAPGRARPPPDRLPRRPGRRLDRRRSAGGRCPGTPRAAGDRRSTGSARSRRPWSTARPPPTSGWPAARPRWSRSTTCWPSACCAGWSSAGSRCPARVSVVGFDDIFGADFCHPPLTTVTSPAEEAGRALIDLLLGARRRARRPGAAHPAAGPRLHRPAAAGLTARRCAQSAAGRPAPISRARPRDR